jgi:AraC-like DNA-binding protein
MIYKSINPSPALQEFVRNYTLAHFRFQDAQAIPAKHRPPKPEQGLVFYLKGYVSQHNLVSGRQQTPATVSLFSHQTDKKLLQLSSEFFMFVIFFHPGILHRLIGIPSLELQQDYHDAELFFGTEVRTITEQLAEAENHASMISIVEAFLLAKFNRMKAASPIDVVANLLLADPTCFTLDEIARQACLSTKQFYRKFVERIGLSPKFFSRLTRFNHSFRYKMAHPHVSWSSVAQEFYYTDYHHLEKEFKEFTGLTPNDWMKQDQAAPERILQLR